MPSRVEIVEHDPRWAATFAGLGAALREALGDVAVRIDHIGSTAVPGLSAKPVIDLQISVRSLEPIDAYRAPLLRLGFVHRADNPERTKRYFREPRPIAGHTCTSGGSAASPSSFRSSSGTTCGATQRQRTRTPP